MQLSSLYGGIAGLAVNSRTSTSNPGTNYLYSIANCYSNTNIELDIAIQTDWLGRQQIYIATQYAAGGIIGGIRSQAVWPENCLYTGNINATYAFTGPIFGILRNKTSLPNQNNANTFNTLWQGNDAGSLTMTSYYTSYSTNGRSFTDDVPSGTSSARISSSTSTWSMRIGYVQGVNKGRYTNSAENMLSNFNNYVQNNQSSNYLTWHFDSSSNGFYFIPELKGEVNKNYFTYTIKVNDTAQTGNYTYAWYIDESLDQNLTGNTMTMDSNWIDEHVVEVLISNGRSYAMVSFKVEKLEIHISFEIDNDTNTLTAGLEGTGTNDPNFNLNDYTYEWYKIDVAEGEEKIEGATTNSISNLEENIDYKIIATNTQYSYMSTEGTYGIGERTVIYCSYSNGNDSNNGFTPDTPVKTLSKAYSKFKSETTREQNIIVLMGNYTSDTSFLEDETSTTYNKNVTITGKYNGTLYNAVLAFEGSDNGYRYLNGNTTFMYLAFDGTYSNWWGGSENSQTYLYLQGYSLTMGDGITMQNYETSNPNQGLIKGNAPAFHIFAGWLKYDYSTLPRNNAKILIKSGTYGRIILGGSPGTTGAENLEMYTSHNFIGSSLTDDVYSPEITVDIKNSTKPSNYVYDINLLVGGSACGNIYGDVQINIKNGTIGRLLGASIGDSSDIPNNWNYPINTFIGTATINMTGGSVAEMYGGCLGRNMGAIDTTPTSSIICDSYFYGTVNINISGGTVSQTIYGAGAGGVSGYSEKSTDTYKSYGKNIKTVVSINISGGIINADVYGGGYGYTEYLTADTTQTDGGTLYGDSNIVITGSPTINGNIYAAGRGYDLSSDKTDLAQMDGNSTITISGTPKITGSIYGGGMGLSQYENMAKLTGNTTININADLDSSVFGGGNIAKTSGTTSININGGKHIADIYGGGNVGILEGTSNVIINGGASSDVYGGGKSADVKNSNLYIKGGEATNVYGGGNQAGSESTNIEITGGTTTNVYGGSNQSGTIQTTTINAKGGAVNTIFGGNNAGGNCPITTVTIDGTTITEAVYGGGNQVATTTTNVYLNGSFSIIPQAFGGGKSADATTTNVYCKGANATEVFGGSNTSGYVENSNITITDGNISNAYGGNNLGGTNEESHITISGGISGNIYGGGNQALTTTTNVLADSGKIDNIYGGGNQAGATTTNVTIYGGEISNAFGGANQSGNVTNTNITLDSSTQTQNENNLKIYGGNNAGGTTIASNVNIKSGIADTVYGGNNLGGMTQIANVITTGGKVTNVYGGGNKAVTNETYVNINSEISNCLYGGGNEAGVNKDTHVNIENANIGGSVYGGGNEGIVSGNTYVTVKDSKLLDSLYAGGNGVTAVVYGNTNLIMHGTQNQVTNSVFGGGNQAATGTSGTNNSTSTVNIVGGTIGKNVYGGANTSVVYGVTNINIGYDSVADDTLTLGQISIEGTVFGGGEANASGSEIYDYDFISVTTGINININGIGHDKCEIKGSIFGSGNASSSGGYSYINLKNYGSEYSLQRNVSIQRANIVTVDNSAITLSGAKDRTNEYSNEFFTLSRIDELKLKNGSILYLNYGANLLQKFTSCVEIDGSEVKAAVTIDEETGEITKNVDNRIYMAEGKNLNIATNEKVTTFGEVSGMTFFGLFTNTINPSTSTGLYNREYNNGDKITNEGTFSSNSYVKGAHKADHDITVDGFYSNYNDEDNPGHIRTKYVGVTPAEGVYYIWLVGIELEVTTYEVTLTGSKYATLGTYELGLSGFETPNTKFVLSGYSAGLADGISLVDPSEIKSVALDENVANTVFGLTMKTGNSGWMTKNITTFLTANGGTYTGSSQYNCDNSSAMPTLNLYLYHAENISIAQTLGSVKIRLQALTPIDDLNDKVSYIDINITLLTALYQNDFYEAAIAPGEQFGLFTTTETNITDSSLFTTYYSLYIPDFSESDYYEDYKQYKHVLVSRKSSGEEYAFPANTKITMLDMVTNKYYYYVVSQEDEQNMKFQYNLSDFITMGSDNCLFDEQKAWEEYYNTSQDLIYENFIFHIDFSENVIESDLIKNTLLMELRGKEDEILIGVLGIQRDSMVYSVYKDKDAKIKVNANVSDNIVYLGNKFTLTVTTEITQDIINSKTIYDTQYFDEKMGIKISMYDNDGNRLNNDSLLGVSFMLDNVKYYPRIDGTVRIKTADKVTNVLSKIIIDTAENTVLATGDYTIRVESFGSPDGIYYGIESSDMAEVKVTIIESSYGLNVYTDDNSKIIEKDTGYTQKGNNSLLTNIEYSSKLDNPSIAVSLYRRDYSSIYSQNYTLVDLSDYLSIDLTPTKNEKEYVISKSPTATMQYFMHLDKNLVTGTYKLVFKLYDNDEYIGEAYEYLIIK